MLQNFTRYFKIPVVHMCIPFPFRT